MVFISRAEPYLGQTISKTWPPFGDIASSDAHRAVIAEARRTVTTVESPFSTTTGVPWILGHPCGTFAANSLPHGFLKAWTKDLSNTRYLPLTIHGQTFLEQPKMLWLLLFALHPAFAAVSVNFQWEKAQLAVNETAASPDIAFGDATGSNATYKGPKCKIGPGDPGWPTVDEWTKLNNTLGGVLLKPRPPGAVCYPGPEYDATLCRYLLTTAPMTRFYAENPINVLTGWAEGSTCDITPFPTGNCSQGGFPAYVVNATKVRHIQLAVNFARNRNLRLVIKNSGHDFAGRSTGAGALSIWTHFLKDFEFIPNHTIDGYKGRVAKVSAGIEAWELMNYMDTYNMTMAVPGGDTVGAYGGWSAGGGHNLLSSSYGHGADQILSFQVVTADGRYRSVTPHQNADLFFAMLGGTYGILTSAIVKAYPATPVIEVPLSFQVGPGFPFGNLSFPPGLNGSSPFPPLNGTFPGNPNFPFPPLNGTFPSNPSFPFPGPGNFSGLRNGTFPGVFSPVTVNDTEIFWEGVWLYQYSAPAVTDIGGTLYSNINKLSNNSYSFTTTFKLPNMTPQQALSLVKPLFQGLGKLGIPVSLPIISQATPTGFVRNGAGGGTGNIYFASRLFPRANWDNTTIYNKTFSAIRATVEAGYNFHGVNFWTPHSVAGFPSNMTAINPTWRRALMHADIYDSQFRGLNGVSAAAVKEGHTRFNDVVDAIRRATPLGGAYYNEADVQEPNWQQTFFGAYYPRLLQIKKARDPWGLFWAPTMPGSEGWKVVMQDALPTQNGPLCQTGWVEGAV
ncbi:hypothetical protein B0H63DRAFT_519257 [Podospora didyma]|uniref:FAD-binding PCMH-type domain-containing protein n=1 Tax=Podospora didyma TaxID=330526 RepID=A0AAE0U3V5_9PEZI|nr:hypothetical protein B0H63DRAFT_519257 [Podospora didyma]